MTKLHKNKKQPKTTWKMIDYFSESTREEIRKDKIENETKKLLKADLQKLVLKLCDELHDKNQEINELSDIAKTANWYSDGPLVKDGDLISFSVDFEFPIPINSWYVYQVESSDIEMINGEQIMRIPFVKQESNYFEINIKGAKKFGEKQAVFFTNKLTERIFLDLKYKADE